jgi:hypothetical protein
MQSSEEIINSHAMRLYGDAAIRTFAGRAAEALAWSITNGNVRPELIQRSAATERTLLVQLSPEGPPGDSGIPASEGYRRALSDRLTLIAAQDRRNVALTEDKRALVSEVLQSRVSAGIRPTPNDLHGDRMLNARNEQTSLAEANAAIPSTSASPALAPTKAHNALARRVVRDADMIAAHQLAVGAVAEKAAMDIIDGTNHPNAVMQPEYLTRCIDQGVDRVVNAFQVDVAPAKLDDESAGVYRRAVASQMITTAIADSIANPDDSFLATYAQNTDLSVVLENMTQHSGGLLDAVATGAQREIDSNDSLAG